VVEARSVQQALELAQKGLAISPDYTGLIDTNLWDQFVFGDYFSGFLVCMGINISGLIVSISFLSSGLHK
jgi:hypothetical protein